jgi:hypothetical protein
MKKVLDILNEKCQGSINGIKEKYQSSKEFIDNLKMLSSFLKEKELKHNDIKDIELFENRITSGCSAFSVAEKKKLVLLFALITPVVLTMPVGMLFRFIFFSFGPEIFIYLKTISLFLSKIKESSYREDSQLDLYARVAEYVYGIVSEDILPRGWHEINIPNVKFEDKKTGLKSVLLQKGYSEEYIYAFAGTSNMTDWKENGKQIGGISNQYEQALENAEKIIDYLPMNSNISFTGHSQGGGEAAACAYKFGKKAVTFNPAGMSVITKILNTTKSSFSSNIHSYIYLTDLLNIVQELTSYFPFLSLQADGTRHYVWDKIPRKLSIDEFHGMKGFLSYMGIETTERTSFTEKG